MLALLPFFQKMWILTFIWFGLETFLQTLLGQLDGMAATSPTHGHFYPFKDVDYFKSATES